VEHKSDKTLGTIVAKSYDDADRGRGELRGKVIAQLQTVHALKSSALRMFGPMLADVRRQKDSQALPEVHDLLERMASAFGGHEEATRDHEHRARARLRALGAGTSKPREAALGTAAVMRGHLGRIGGQNHGAAARDAFVFEHLEIASWELLEHLAERVADSETAELARSCRGDDDDMAALIRQNFPNVLSLMLASEGLPTMREVEEPIQKEEHGREVSAENHSRGSEALGGPTGVSVQDAARLHADGEAVVLDVRDSPEWEAGHIPDALWIPMDEVEGRRDELPRDRRVVTVCRSGKRSGTVAAGLRERGYEADNIRGGMETWREAGLPMEPVDGYVA